MFILIYGSMYRWQSWQCCPSIWERLFCPETSSKGRGDSSRPSPSQRVTGEYDSWCYTTGRTCRLWECWNCWVLVGWQGKLLLYWGECQTSGGAHSHRRCYWVSMVKSWNYKKWNKEASKLPVSCKTPQAHRVAWATGAIIMLFERRDLISYIKTLKAPITTKVVWFVVCWNILEAGAVWSGTTLFCPVLTLLKSNNVSKSMQQTT